MRIDQKYILTSILSSSITLLLVVSTKKMWAFIPLSILISSGLGYFIGRSYKTTFREINDVLKKLSNGRGDLTIKLPEGRRDELGELSRNFNLILEEVEQIVAKVNVTSKLVAESSINLSENLINILDNKKDEKHMQALREKMEFIADSVNKQTAYSEEAAASTTEISQSINNIYERAENTRNLAIETNNLAKESEKNIVINIKELETIEDSVDEIENKVNLLEVSSNRIYDIVEMINKITEQTSLLSLNAAIEAARAGEAGRGFSIVADEVRKLANNSSDATSQIEDLVKAIQNEVKELVILTKASSEKVQTGRKTTENTNKKILTIIEKIDTTSSEVEQISISIREQKQAVEEINIAMDQISNRSVEISNLSNDQLEANESISNTLREATGYSAKLSEISDALKNVAINYKINEGVEIKRNKAVEWSDDFSVKISLMDDEHKRLFDLINDLNDAMLDGRSSSKIGEILDSLIDYTTYHFGHEEDMLRGINYPNINEQEVSHRTFVNKMKQFKKELESGEMLLSVKIIDFLKDWLVSHIVNVDTKYTGYAHQRGIN